MAKLPIVAEGFYGTREVYLYDSATLLESSEIHKKIDIITIEFKDTHERRAIREDDENLKIWIHYVPCEYCKSIDESTKKSPRKKYKFCPMCGRVRR
jgi:hypothetical protein